MSPRALVRPRWRSALAAALTIPLGLLTRADIPLPAVIATYGGDTLYATLIFFLAALLWPCWPTWRLAAIALGFCYVIELSQLYQAPWLDALRGTLPGRLVLGSGFRWDDLLCYAVGVLLATVELLPGLLRPRRRPRSADDRLPADQHRDLSFPAE